MLLELKVANFAIIENIHVQFQKGLNILTGETGAGKSVLLKSLALLMGTKGSSESIRTGYQQASIEGSFDLTKRTDMKKKLAELAIECEDDILIVKRVIVEGKSRVYINGSLNTLNTLRDLVSPLIEVAGQTPPLIELTGQFDNRNLLSKAYHMDLLDQYCGIWKLRTQYLEKFKEWKSIQNEIDSVANSSQDASQRLDFLKFQRDEIAELDLLPGQEFELENEVRRMKNSEKISEFISFAENVLIHDQDSAVSRLGSVLKKAQDFSRIEPQIPTNVEELKLATIQIEETLYKIRQNFSVGDDREGRLEKIEAKLSLFRKLQKKYGQSVGDILQALVQMEKEIAILENADTHIAGLKEKLKTMAVGMTKLANDLHERRTNGSKIFCESINAELNDLNMKGVTFLVDVQRNAVFDSAGLTTVEFMSRSSKKDSAKPLAKFASGGELSRILLSLKRVVGTSEQPRTYLFDEVDAGVSGTTAEKVGKKLKSIAKGQQVICVTHLPQVAAFADSHFFIQKTLNKKGSNEGVSVELIMLNKEKQIQEIARLISGEKITQSSLTHAKELLKVVN